MERKPHDAKSAGRLPRTTSNSLWKCRERVDIQTRLWEKLQTAALQRVSEGLVWMTWSHVQVEEGCPEGDAVFMRLQL